MRRAGYRDMPGTCDAPGRRPPRRARAAAGPPPRAPPTTGWPATATCTRATRTTPTAAPATTTPARRSSTRRAARSAQRFAEAAAKGLDFLVVSDHDDVRAWSDPAFGSQRRPRRARLRALAAGGRPRARPRRVAAPRRRADPGALAAAAHADGALLQANHPTYRADARARRLRGQAAAASARCTGRRASTCVPTRVEVWNPTALLRARRASSGSAGCSAARGCPRPRARTRTAPTRPTSACPRSGCSPRDRTRPRSSRRSRDGRTTITRLPPALGGRHAPPARGRRRPRRDVRGDDGRHRRAGHADARARRRAARARHASACAPTARTSPRRAALPGAPLTFTAPPRPAGCARRCCRTQRTRADRPELPPGRPAPAAAASTSARRPRRTPR